MKKTLLLILACQIFLSAFGQGSTIDILQKTYNNIHSLKSLSYSESSVNKNMFSSGDTSFVKINSILLLDNGAIKAMNQFQNINKGQSKFRSIYRKDTLYTLLLKDSIYTADKIGKDDHVYDDVITFANILKDNMLKNRARIFKRHDTIDHGRRCYNIFVITYDTMLQGKHNYNHVKLLIDKNTLLPVYYKETGEGIAEKDGHFIGRVSSFTEEHFSEFKVNNAIRKSDFKFNRSTYRLKNDHMLADGSVAPKLDIKDLSNNKIPAANFENKVLLIEFGSTDCSANPLANPMLNALNKKYNSRDFAIVSIYTGETADQVQKYAVSNKLEFPIYIGDSKLSQIFQKLGTPGFYLVGKNGQIITSSNGFSDELEKDLSTAIDKALTK